jgi:hypothetical protein
MKPYKKVFKKLSLSVLPGQQKGGTGPQVEKPVLA